MRLVPDTSVVVSAFRSPQGASRVSVDAFARGHFIWLLSNPLLLEYEAVLTRPEQMHVHGLSHSEIDKFLARLVQQATLVSLHRRVRPQLRDANDDFVLETAINGDADAIVTHNVRDFLPQALAFRLRVLTPGAALADTITV